MEDTTEAQQRWMPESILVSAGTGREPIDIAPLLIDDQNEFALLRTKGKRVEFPADVYLPSWDNRKDIESAVRTAVSVADNVNLIVLFTNPQSKKIKNPIVTLGCDCSVSYRPPKNANDIQANVHKDMENMENQQRIEKPGVRQDIFINKMTANRKDGQSQPKRTYTEKPSKEHRCPFRIRLFLDPGKCWYIPSWTGCRCHKFHTKLPPNEKRRRMDTCTREERRDSAIFAQQSSAGVAAGIVREQTFGTNSEGRPLAVTASFDAFLKTFTPIRAFLPSECQWVFQWLWTTAIPALLGKENISRIQLMLTDGDPKIYTPFNSVREELYPSAIHGLCIFHLLTQPLGKLDIRERADESVKAMIKT
jgi:hypothetical protein